MSLATTLAKQTATVMLWGGPILLGLLSGADVILDVVPYKWPYVFYLNDVGCAVAKEAGLNPTPVQDGICAIEGKAELHDRSIVISGVFLDRDYVIAGKKMPR